MKKDLPENIVEDIFIAIVLESAAPDHKNWRVYLINQKEVIIKNVLITSKGYGIKNGENVKTSVLRHMFEQLAPNSFVAVELIDEQVFGLSNEYWVSYYIDGTIFDKKFIFLPESIIESNLIRIPVVNKPGVMIGK